MDESLIGPRIVLCWLVFLGCQLAATDVLAEAEKDLFDLSLEELVLIEVSPAPDPACKADAFIPLMKLQDIVAPSSSAGQAPEALLDPGRRCDPASCSEKE